MRPQLKAALAAMALVLALGGCVLPGGQSPDGADVSPITGPQVETTALPPVGASTGGETAPDDQSSGGKEGAASNPDPEPEATAAPVADPAPPAVKSPAQIACEKLGGRLVRVGSGSAMACQRVMRDAGKSCRRKSDCEGECLARSGTCAPLDPLFGCNDVLQDDGRQVSLCID